MKLSVGKNIWNICSKLLTIAFWMFFILVIILWLLIIKQANLDFSESCIFLVILCSVYSFLSIFALSWRTMIVAAFFYFICGQQLIPFLITGIINSNFIRSLPSFINNIVGFTVQGRVIDFIFWSGFILSVLFVVSKIQHKILLLLAKHNVGFALEIIEKEKAKLMEKKKKYLEAQANLKPISGKQKVIISIVCILLVGLISSSPFLFEKWQNRNYPILWEQSFSGTVIWLQDCQKCGKK